MILLKEQKLFSTGDSELDGILEEVYYSGISDGYDYAQREFSGSGVKKQAERNLKKARKDYWVIEQANDAVNSNKNKFNLTDIRRWVNEHQPIDPLEERVSRYNNPELVSNPISRKRIIARNITGTTHKYVKHIRP